MLRLSPWQQAGWGTSGANSSSWGCLDIPHPQDLLYSKVSFEQWIMKILFGLGYAYSWFHADCVVGRENLHVPRSARLEV